MTVAFQSLHISADGDRVQAHIKLLLRKNRVSGFRQSLSSLGLHLEDEVVHVATGLRLGLFFCTSRLPALKAQVEQLGLHGLSCKKSQGRHI